MKQICLTLTFGWIVCTGSAVAQSSEVSLRIEGKTELVVAELPFSVLAPVGDPKKTLHFWTFSAGVEAVDKGHELHVLKMSGRQLFQVRIVEWSPDGFTQKFGKLYIRLAASEPPPPEPGPLPPKVKMLFLVAVEESREAKADRARWLTYKPLHDYMRNRGYKARIVDKDVKNANGQTPEDLAPYLLAAQGNPLPYLFLVTQDGDVLYRGGLPSSPAQLLALMQKVDG